METTTKCTTTRERTTNYYHHSSSIATRMTSPFTRKHGALCRRPGHRYTRQKLASLKTALTCTLSTMADYYTRNQLRTNPSKTQVSIYLLRNCEANRQLNINWNGVPLAHCTNHVYCGVTLDRTLSFKTHTEKTKGKVNSRNPSSESLTTHVRELTPAHCVLSQLHYPTR